MLLSYVGLLQEVADPLLEVRAKVGPMIIGQPGCGSICDPV